MHSGQPHPQPTSSSPQTPLPHGVSGATETLALVRRLSGIAARAADPGETVQEMLALLCETGIILGGAVDLPSLPGQHWSLGEKPDIMPPSEAAEPLLLEVSDPTPLLTQVETIPTRFAPAAYLSVITRHTPDSTLLEIAAEQIALVLDRFHLNQQATDLHHQAERRIREVSTIYEIGQVMDSREIGDLLNIITEKAAKIMDAQACSLMRLHPKTNSLTIAASYGLSEDVVEVTRRALGEGIAGRVAQTGKPLLIRDNDSDPRLPGVALRPEIGSSMVVPLSDKEGVVRGVLSIRRRHPAPDFNEEDLRLFSVFASQASLAIHNQQLYDESRTRVRELSTVSELTQAVISQLELPTLLHHVVDNIVEVVGFDRCCIYSLERSARRFAPRALRGFRQNVIGHNPVRLGEGVVGLVAKEQQPIEMTDARNAPQPVRGFARALGTNAFLAVPIISKGQSIGVLLVDNKLSGRPIQSENRELLTTFVNQAGIAIENAQLYEDLENRYLEMNQLATQTDNILRSILSAVLVVDNSGKVMRWNQAACDMWGISDEQAVRMHFPELIEHFGLSDEEKTRMLTLIQASKESWRPERVLKMPLRTRQRGQFYVDIRLSPLIDRHGDRQGIVVVIEDVTREQRMETEMMRIRRLADIGQLAASMAHEVRNPLSSIKGAAQLLRNDYEEIAPLREFLDIIIEEVNGLSRITTDLLDFARPMQLDSRTTNLNKITVGTLHFMEKYLYDNQVTVVLELEEALPDTHADPRQIEQVIRNVVINAVQAMPEGGSLTIRTKHDKQQSQVILQIQDTGIGIAADKMEEIFQPFFTTKAKGTGLGLSIVRKIVENHGGQVEVESIEGLYGTCFGIRLPYRPPVTQMPTLHHTRPSADLTALLPDL